MLPSITFTTPPTALLPYSSVAGPRTISTWRAARGSNETAWSGLVFDASAVPRPLCSTRMRSPPRPRITGRDAPGPK
jgi:hypothetical protein